MSSKLVKATVDKLVEKGMIQPEHREEAEHSLETELRRRARLICAILAKDVGDVTLLAKSA